VVPEVNLPAGTWDVAVAVALPDVVTNDRGIVVLSTTIGADRLAAVRISNAVCNTPPSASCTRARNVGVAFRTIAGDEHCK